jgi:hypothetical protein
MCVAMAVFMVALAVRAKGLKGEYGFISSAALAAQPEHEIRSRVQVMAQRYGIREFMFYDWFADYATPMQGEQWTDAYFRKHPIRLATIRTTLDEIHKQGGRAWAYVQAVGTEEGDPATEAQGVQKVIDADGKWYWHPPKGAPRFPTYLPNAAWADVMVKRWAPAVKELGFDGIHWDTLGAIAGDHELETRGVHAFLRTAHKLLEEYGLPQTINLVDMNWWDPDVILAHTEFPYVEAWSVATQKRYQGAMVSPALKGVHGVLAMYPTTAAPKGQTAEQIVAERRTCAQAHNLVYVIVGDGERRMINEYWPNTVPLEDSLRTVLSLKVKQ